MFTSTKIVSRVLEHSLSICWLVCYGITLLVKHIKPCRALSLASYPWKVRRRYSPRNSFCIVKHEVNQMCVSTWSSDQLCCSKSGSDMAVCAYLTYITLPWHCIVDGRSSFTVRLYEFNLLLNIYPSSPTSYDFGSCTLCKLRGKRKTKSTTPRAALFLKEKRRAALGGIRTHDTQASAIATQLVGVLVIIHNTAQRQTSTTVLYNHVQHLSNPGFCGGRGEVTALCLQILLPSCIMHV